MWEPPRMEQIPGHFSSRQLHFPLAQVLSKHSSHFTGSKHLKCTAKLGTDNKGHTTFYTSLRTILPDCTAFRCVSMDIRSWEHSHCARRHRTRSLWGGGCTSTQDLNDAGWRRWKRKNLPAGQKQPSTQRVAHAWLFWGWLQVSGHEVPHSLYCMLKGHFFAVPHQTQPSGQKQWLRNKHSEKMRLLCLPHSLGVLQAPGFPPAWAHWWEYSDMVEHMGRYSVAELWHVSLTQMSTKASRSTSFWQSTMAAPNSMFLQRLFCRSRFKIRFKQWHVKTTWMGGGRFHTCFSQFSVVGELISVHFLSSSLTFQISP